MTKFICSILAVASLTIAAHADETQKALFRAAEELSESYQSYEGEKALGLMRLLEGQVKFGLYKKKDITKDAREITYTLADGSRLECRRSYVEGEKIEARCEEGHQTLWDAEAEHAMAQIENMMAKDKSIKKSAKNFSVKENVYIKTASEYPVKNLKLIEYYELIAPRFICKQSTEKVNLVKSILGWKQKNVECNVQQALIDMKKWKSFENIMKK